MNETKTYTQIEGEKVYSTTIELITEKVQLEITSLIDEELELEEVYLEVGDFEVSFSMVDGFEKSFCVSYLGGDASVKMEKDVKEICLKAISEYELDKEANF